MTIAATGEHAFTFKCGDAALIGIVHATEKHTKRGVLVVVGGPQYRVGSHRQFALLARSLAAHGIPTMRFDHRGIGDSDEPFRGFEALNPDIAAAIDVFIAECPGLREVVLWGLCDAASAILLYAHRDPRVTGVVLLNPWVRTKESEGRAYLRHYYAQRFADPSFWRSLFSGRVNVQHSARSLLGFVAQRLRLAAGSDGANPDLTDAGPLPDRMAEGLAKFAGPVLVILSGQDLTAREFEDSARLSATWPRLLADRRVSRRNLPAADHTFSRREWRDKVGEWTSEWVQRL
jgi:uncharacterized protein